MSFIALALLMAADFSGTWIGDTTDFAFQLVQKGSVLTGKQYGDQQSTTISKATLSGDLISFVLVRQEQSGNEINESRIRFTGRLINGELELTRERESSTRAGSGASANTGKNPRQTFRLNQMTK